MVTLKKKDLLSKIKELIPSGQWVDMMDVARLTHCLLMACILAPGKNGLLPWYPAEFLEDLVDAGNYDWSCYIVKLLIMTDCKNMPVAGCTMLLLYWLCEHTKIVTPLYPEKNPRCLRWDLNDIYSKLKRIDLAGIAEQQVVEEIKPTTREKGCFRVLLKLCQSANPLGAVHSGDGFEENHSNCGSSNYVETDNDMSASVAGCGVYERAFMPAPLTGCHVGVAADQVNTMIVEVLMDIADEQGGVDPSSNAMARESANELNSALAGGLGADVPEA